MENPTRKELEKLWEQIRDENETHEDFERWAAEHNYAPKKDGTFDKTDDVDFRRISDDQ